MGGIYGGILLGKEAEERRRLSAIIYRETEHYAYISEVQRTNTNYLIEGEK